MSRAVLLRQLHDYAKSVLDLAEHAPEVSDHIRPLLAQLEQAAKAAIAASASPLKIGFVGEFSAGKTVLLGALVGRGDILPVDAQPTTGNVTALKLTPTEDGETRLTRFVIEHMRRDIFLECVRFMLDEADRRARQASLPDALLTQLQRLRDAEVDLDKITAWCQSAWSAKSPRMRYLIRELVWAIRAYGALGAKLGGKRCSVDAKLAFEGLRIPAFPRDIREWTFIDLLESLPAFDVEVDPDALTVEVMRAAFPLVRRAEIELEVPRRVWDLGAFSNQGGFVLLDFPGLGADASGVRDAFLCLRELQDVHTILVVLNGQRPGSGEAQVLYDMMAKDRVSIADSILVGVGRFAELPVSEAEWVALAQLSVAAPPKDDGFLDTMLSSSGHGVTADKVYRTAPVLERAIANAREFTLRADRVVLLSPFLALDDRRKATGQAVGSAALHAELDRHAEASRTARDRWRMVADALDRHAPGTDLAMWLGQLDGHGGVDALRELIQTHVEAHGMRLVLDATVRAVARIETLKAKLAHALEATPETQARGEPGTRDLIRRLLQDYYRLRADLDHFPRRMIAERGEKRVFLTDLVEERVAVEIHGWPDWRRLRSKLNTSSGLLETDVRADNILDTLPGGATVPLVSEDLHDAFIQSCERLEAWTHDAARRALGEWLVELSERLAALANDLQPLLTSEVEDRLRTEDERRLLRHLRAAIDPRVLEPALARACRVDETAKAKAQKAIDRERWLALFPLPPERRFAWDPALANSTPRSERHIASMRKLQDELVTSVCRELTEFVGHVDNVASATLSRAFREVINSLIDMLNHPDFANRLEGTEAPSGLMSSPLLATRLRGLEAPAAVRDAAVQRS